MLDSANNGLDKIFILFILYLTSDETQSDIFAAYTLLPRPTCMYVVFVKSA